MNVNLSDELKNLKITLQLSVDSVTVGTTVGDAPAVRLTSVNSVSITARSDGQFDVDIDATTCKVWAKWFAVSGAGTISEAANPFENDGGTSLLYGVPAPIVRQTINPGLSGGNDTVVVRVWSLDTGASCFGTPRQARATRPSSSSSSSSRSSSSISSASSSSRSSLSSGNSSGSTSSRSSVNSSGSTVSMSSMNSTSSSPSTPSSPSSPSTPSGTSGTSPFPRPARK